MAKKIEAWPASSDYIVPHDESFEIAGVSTSPPKDAPSKGKLKNALESIVEEIGDLQEVLYAFDRHSLLLVFQAMDAAGKDGTIRAVMTGVNPAGCQVFSFKQPSSEELDHDFLWRTSKCLPERGRIGIFNRSYYEEVLVVRVHPEILDAQKLPAEVDRKNIWSNRLSSIVNHERHLAENGTVILKFFLNLSRDEQRERFLARIDNPKKNWKFSGGDVKERAYWDSYMDAYQEALGLSSKPWAPWYAIPADSKPFMRLTVATIIRDTLKNLGLKHPELSKTELERLEEYRASLLSD